MKKVLCGLVALLMFAGAFCSCNGTKKQPTQSEEPATSSVDTRYEPDNLPTDIDYDREFNIFGWQNTRGEYTANPESTDNVEQAVFKRNSAVESRFGVWLNFNTETLGDNANQNVYIGKAQTIMSGNENYDLFASYSMCAMTMALNGWLADLSGDGSYIQFDKPWWPGTMVENVKINDHVYFATGDISLAYFYSMMFILGNMDMMSSRGIQTDPREEVLDGTWTIERMFEYTKDIYVDSNNNQVEDGYDTYGFVMRSNVYVDMFLSGSGFCYIDRDGDGNFVLGKDATNASRGMRLLEIFAEQFGKSSSHLGNEDKETAAALPEGRALFFTTAPAQLIEAVASGMEYSYAILPTPKYDKQQDRYYTNCSFTYTAYSIPTVASDFRASSLIMEALASEGYRNTTVAFYDTNLKYRYAGDELNYEMFEILRTNPYFEVTRFCYNSLSSNPIEIMRGKVANQSTTLTSAMTSVAEYLDEFIKQNLTQKKLV